MMLISKRGSKSVGRLTQVQRTFAAASIPRQQQTVRQQLHDVQALSSKVGAENSKTQKAEIIRGYPHLRDLLEHVYDPSLRLHTTSKALSSISAHITSGKTPYTSISALFNALSARQVTGNAAKQAIADFLLQHEVAEDQGAMEVFKRLIDRNLTAGFGANTLKMVRWPSAARSAASTQATSASTISSTPGRKTTMKSTSSVTPSAAPKRSLDQISPALGKTVLISDFPKLFIKNGEWYASRKLDGVRVLLVIDMSVGAGGTVTISSIAPLSRAGNRFTSLSLLEEEVRSYLPSFLERTKWLQDPAYDSGNGKRLVIDGEVCVMRSRRPDEKLHLAASSTSSSTIDTDGDLIEDFSSTVGMVKRKDSTIPNPVFFVLDVIPGRDFDAHAGTSTFVERIEQAAELVGATKERAEKDGKRPIVRKLDQWKVQDIPQLEGMVERAAKEGWEGLVIRQDAPYEGKRTTKIRKFKQWQDAEYTVVDVDCSKMRLAVDGVFEERMACRNVWIEHKGTRVSVGSGFDVNQRLRYAEDPSRIIGKQITLEYFSESTSSSRGGDSGATSLRFPRVKTVWEDGKRNI